jgi:hypothetical protein
MGYRYISWGSTYANRLIQLLLTKPNSSCCQRWPPPPLSIFPKRGKERELFTRLIVYNTLRRTRDCRCNQSWYSLGDRITWKYFNRCRQDALAEKVIYHEMKKVPPPPHHPSVIVTVIVQVAFTIGLFSEVPLSKISSKVVLVSFSVWRFTPPHGQLGFHLQFLPIMWDGNTLSKANEHSSRYISQSKFIRTVEIIS